MHEVSKPLPGFFGAPGVSERPWKRIVATNNLPDPYGEQSSFLQVQIQWKRIRTAKAMSQALSM
jgi:hypothetical protein